MPFRAKGSGEPPSSGSTDSPGPATDGGTAGEPADPTTAPGQDEQAVAADEPADGGSSRWPVVVLGTLAGVALGAAWLRRRA